MTSSPGHIYISSHPELMGMQMVLPAAGTVDTLLHVPKSIQVTIFAEMQKILPKGMLIAVDELARRYCPLGPCCSQLCRKEKGSVSELDTGRGGRKLQHWCSNFQSPSRSSGYATQIPVKSEMPVWVALTCPSTALDCSNQTCSPSHFSLPCWTGSWQILGGVRKNALQKCCTA